MLQSLGVYDTPVCIKSTFNSYWHSLYFRTSTYWDHSNQSLPDKATIWKKKQNEKKNKTLSTLKKNPPK